MTAKNSILSIINTITLGLLLFYFVFSLLGKEECTIVYVDNAMLFTDFNMSKDLGAIHQKALQDQKKLVDSIAGVLQESKKDNEAENLHSQFVFENNKLKEMNDYLSLLDTEVGATNIGMSAIMVQKYIANMLNPETWVDMRRMDYSAAIYPGLKRPINVNLDIFPGSNEWIQGMMYERNEEDRNYINMPTNDPLIRLKTPLWWNTSEQ